MIRIRHIHPDLPRSCILRIITVMEAGIVARRRRPSGVPRDKSMIVNPICAMNKNRVNHQYSDREARPSMANDFWKQVFTASIRGILLAGLPVISGSENGVSTSIMPQRPNSSQIDWGGAV